MTDGAAPGVADGIDHQLDPRSVTADRLSGSITSAILAGASLIGVLLVVLLGPPAPVRRLLFVGAWLLLVSLLVPLSLWWPAVRFRHTAYLLSSREFRIRRGVLWRSVCSVPRTRVQHTDVSQGPIERAFGLATLVIYTAGTQHASVALGGLPHERALAIRDLLIAGGADDAV